MESRMPGSGCSPTPLCTITIAHVYSVRKQGPTDDNIARKTPVYYILTAVQLRFAMIWRIRSGTLDPENHTVR